MELAIVSALRGEGVRARILTPSLDVIRGYLERLSVSVPESENGIAEAGEAVGVTTPIRHRNRVLKGEETVADVYVFDEAHHATRDSDVAGLLMTLASETVWLGFTATPFRGTPKGTRELLDTWGEPTVILTIPEAVSLGVYSVPECSVAPLVDDDKVEVRDGQFVASSATAAVTSRVDALLDLAYDLRGGAPTALIVPSTECAREVQAADERRRGLCRFVGQGVPAKDRAEAYSDVRDRGCVLIAIQVVGEGVDFPWLRRMVDASPTLSPVAWVQRVGRITRPGDDVSLYVSACRNLERHAYLLDGAVPDATIREAQLAFEKPTNRAVIRALGFEALSRFKPITLHLRGGLKGSMHLIYRMENSRKVEYVKLVHPARAETIDARRTSVPGKREWGRWERCEIPADLVGFQTSPWRDKATEKMIEWWRKPYGAKKHGLDPEHVPSGREFAALPVLADLGAEL